MERAAHSNTTRQGRKRAPPRPLPARPPPIFRSPQALSPIWQSLPVELVQRVLHELVSIHLRHIGSDPFYPWETLRQLNHHQRRRIDALYRQLLLPILRLGRSVEFHPTTNRPEFTGIDSGQIMRLWAADEGKGEAYESTNDTITLPLAGCETSYLYTLEAPMHGGYDYEYPSFDTSKGWNNYVNSFPPGGLHVDPEPHYSFTLEWISDLHRWVEGEIPASHLPDVQGDDSDNDSIKVSSSQLIGGLIRAWKKSYTSRRYRSFVYLLAWEDHCHRLLL
ncbi:uncharacterized protein B0T23DRAFT_378796 [Neurospora hispaniola]|uniref:Uncharacterized protein n=1 Tax=Neurospora hispaniola TaxID=588809 RepID=A0AAJ0MT30_9PEZI|nr:hypothetical protein B0T23DRAFT_378796 [Neurospora hispaniola]